ncbi:MAG: DNA-binding protein, partial [Thermoprotei archaeon]
MKLAQGMIGRVLVARLDEGEDLIDGIRKACAEVGIRSGLVVGLGELSEYRV